MPDVGPAEIESYVGDVLVHPLAIASDWWFSTVPEAT